MIIIYTSTAQELQDKNTIVEELIKRLASEDMSAMGKLYEIIKTDIYAYALSKTANRDDSEDIAHDTFVQIYKNAKLYTPMKKPMAWIFTIELNIIRRQYAINKKYVPFDEAIEAKAEEKDFSQSVVDNELLRTIMSTLCEEEREIISLHIVSGMKHREIAELLGKPLSTILSKYNRAIKKLQIQVKEMNQ